MNDAADKLIAVFDVGKTNAKLALVDPVAGREVWSARRPNEVVFAEVGQGYLVWPLSNELALFMLFALLFGLFLHYTRWGRVVFAVGANPVASRFAGIAVNRYRFALFALTGLFSGLAAVLLTSRLGSTRPSIAQGWELEIISMVILGGVSVWGGKGSILGVVLAACPNSFRVPPRNVTLPEPRA